MRELRVTCPGRSPVEILETLRDQLWARRREISSHDFIEGFFAAVRWDPVRRRASGTRRILVFKCKLEVEVEGETAVMRLHVPSRKYERKYGDRIQAVLDTLFDA